MRPGGEDATQRRRALRTQLIAYLATVPVVAVVLALTVGLGAAAIMLGIAALTCLAFVVALRRLPTDEG